MNSAMVATAMLAAAENPGRPEGKVVGQLGHGAALTLTTDESGKTNLTFNPPPDKPK
jgi:hypothetical protein